MFKKNWYLFTPLILVAIPALLTAFYMTSFGYNAKDAWQATQHFVQSSTRYSPNYSDTQFGSVQRGMDGRRVFELIGVPFERHDDDAEWIYSLPRGTSSYYHERTVLFDRDKNNVPHVKTVVSRFHTP